MRERERKRSMKEKGGMIIIRKVYVSPNSICKKKENENKKKHRDVEGCVCF